MQFNAKLVAARWVFGQLPPEDVPKIAADALELGFDGPNLRRLAGMMKPRRDDVASLMDGAFAELRVSVKFTRLEAGLLLAKDAAQRITTGELGEYEGAKLIWWKILIELEPSAPAQLLVFEGLASEYEDHPNCREEIRNEIRRAAEKFSLRED